MRTRTQSKIALGARAMLVLLTCGACLGLAWDVLTIFEALRERRQRGGDGLGLFLPMVGVLLFAPMQIAAGLALVAWRRRPREQLGEHATESELAQQAVIDRGAFEVELAELEHANGDSITRTATLMLG